MSEELKDQRVTIMLTPSEFKAVEDWSFENRIRSRGEAIRRLINRGIFFEEYHEHLSELTKLVLELSQQHGLTEDQFSRLSTVIKTENDNRHKNNAFEYKTFDGVKHLIDTNDPEYADYLKYQEND